MQTDQAMRRMREREKGKSNTSNITLHLVHVASAGCGWSWSGASDAAAGRANIEQGDMHATAGNGDGGGACEAGLVAGGRRAGAATRTLFGGIIFVCGDE